MKKVIAAVMSASLAFSLMLLPSFAFEYDLDQDVQLYQTRDIPFGVPAADGYFYQFIDGELWRSNKGQPSLVAASQRQKVTGDNGYFGELLNMYSVATLADVAASAGVSLSELEGLFSKYFSTSFSSNSSFAIVSGSPYLDNYGKRQVWSGGPGRQLGAINLGLAGLGYLLGEKTYTGRFTTADLGNSVAYLQTLLGINANVPYLTQNGGVLSVNGPSGLAYLVSNGFLGLARRIKEDNPKAFSSFTASTIVPISLMDGLYYINQRLVGGLSHTGTFLNSKGEKYEANLTLTNAVGDGFSGLRSVLGAPVLYVDYIDSSDSELAVNSKGVDGFTGGFALLGQRVQQDLAKLRFVLASDEDIQMRRDLKEQSNAVEQNFTKPGGAGTPSTDDIGALGDVSGAIGGYDPGVNIGDAIGQVSDSGTFKFLSKETQAALNPFYNYDSPAPAALSDDEFIDFLGQNTVALEALLGGGK